jgi:hypothetical protein
VHAVCLELLLIAQDVISGTGTSRLPSASEGRA